MKYVLIGVLAAGKAFVISGAGLVLTIAIGNVVSRLRRKWRA